jgi:hypothetical protein
VPATRFRPTEQDLPKRTYSRPESLDILSLRGELNRHAAGSSAHVVPPGGTTMTRTVSLQTVVDGLEMVGTDRRVFLNPETGEVVMVSDDEAAVLDSDPDRDLEDWEREERDELREVLESDRYLCLPDSFEIHEWAIMRQFCDTVEDDEARQQLLDAIHGRGAFRFFHQTTQRLGIRERWFEYRAAAFEIIAKDWLDANGLAYR